MRGQPQSEDREGDQDHQPNQVGNDEGDHALEDGGKTHVFYHAFDDKDVHAHRRMDQPEFDGHDDDDAEPDRVEAEMGNDRKDDGHGQDDHGHGVHQAAKDEVHQHDQRQDAVAAEAERCEE